MWGVGIRDRIIGIRRIVGGWFMVGWNRGIGMRRRGLGLCEQLEERRSFRLGLGARYGDGYLSILVVAA